MAFLQTQWWQLHGRGCLTWTGGGLIINELFKRFGSKRSQEVIALAALQLVDRRDAPICRLSPFYVVYASRSTAVR